MENTITINIKVYNDLILEKEALIKKIFELDNALEKLSIGRLNLLSKFVFEDMILNRDHVSRINGVSISTPNYIVEKIIKEINTVDTIKEAKIYIGDFIYASQDVSLILTNKNTKEQIAL